MLDQSRELYGYLKRFHKYADEEVEKLDTKVAGLELLELIDLAYFLREAKKFIDDLKTSLNKLDTKTKKIANMRWAMERPNADKLRTNYCSAQQNVKVYAKYPAKRKGNEEAFDALCRFFGIPQEIAECEGFRPNFNGIKNLLAERIAKGETLPEGTSLNEEYVDYDLSIRKIRDI